MGIDRELPRLKRELVQTGAVLYEGLSPEGRFRLVIQARNSGDDTEDQRLRDTCPVRTYTMPDAAVVNRLQAVDTLALAFCIDIAILLAKLQIAKGQDTVLGYLKEREFHLAALGWYRGYDHGLAEGWKLAGMEGEPRGKGEDEADESLRFQDVSPEEDSILKASRDVICTLEVDIPSQ